jgi:hypothetical protein
LLFNNTSDILYILMKSEFLFLENTDLKNIIKCHYKIKNIYLKDNFINFYNLINLMIIIIFFYLYKYN